MLIHDLSWVFIDWGLLMVYAFFFSNFFMWDPIMLDCSMFYGFSLIGLFFIIVISSDGFWLFI